MFYHVPASFCCRQEHWMESQKVNVQLKELFENVFGGGGGIRSIAFFQELRKKTQLLKQQTCNQAEKIMRRQTI